MPNKIASLWKRAVAYGTFFVLALVLMLQLTFPYDVLAELVHQQAGLAGVELSIGSLGPAPFGVKARQVALRLPRHEAAAAGEPLLIDEISLGPSLLPLGVRYSARLFGGHVAGRLGVFGRPRLVAELAQVDLGRANAKEAVGLDLAGTLSGLVDLEVNPKDTTQLVGRVALAGEGLAVRGGTVGSYDLPAIDLGHVEAEVQADKGRAEVKNFRAEGADVEALVEGGLTLAQQLLLSPLQLQVKFKLSEGFLKKNSFIQTGLSFAMAKDAKGFYAGRVERVLGNPKFVPTR